MQMRFWMMVMWRLSTAFVMLLALVPGAKALDLTKPEVLKYGVYWGFVRMGDATLEYMPRDGGYTVRAWVKDDSRLIDLEDSWEARGVHTVARPFGWQVYEVKQSENKYRAHKTMRFDVASGQVKFANLLNAADTSDPLVMGQARDVLSTIYNWRLGGDDEVKRAAKVEAVSLKKPLSILRDAGVQTTLKLNGKSVPVWKVVMRTVTGSKPSKDMWTVYLRDDATMVPVQITATTKFGTFQAILDQ